MARRAGIMRRWMVNSLGVIVLLLLFFSVIFMLAIRANYYKGVEYQLSSHANDLIAQLNAMDNASSAEMSSPGYYPTVLLRDRGLILIDSLEDDRERLELQILDEDGHILLTSLGVEADAETVPAGFAQASKATDGRNVWTGRNEQGEVVMALSIVRYNDHNVVVGALRFVTSLEQVNNQIGLMVGLIVLIGIAVVFFVMVSSTYFINSIVHPVAEINRTARQIALGDYDARIGKYADDEIGDLCDTINYMAGEIATAETIKNEFISSVSHELRTPLTAIKGWAETLRAGAGRDELTDKGLEVIVSESERLSGIVEELLDFSRMSSGHLNMRFERIDLTVELSEAVVLMNDRTEREGIELQFIDTGRMPPVLGDRDRLRQVFINIIDNAVKYSDRGDRIRIEAADMGSHVQVVVSDTGMGIAAADLPRVKERFYKANNQRPGSGIGLALVDEIMRRHRGSMDIDSEEGVGTTVTLNFPVALGDSRMPAG